ncbi:Thioredoxin-like 4A [Podila verticillata]|nr:Thioredoxin-like 4A [Podila verticillata]
MSAFLSHLTNVSEVDQAILTEDGRVVILRFGADWDPTCKAMDELLHSISDTIKNFAVIYLVDNTQVPEFNRMYELYDSCTIMFFYRCKHIMVDRSNGSSRKTIWAVEDKQEMINFVETVYRDTRKGRGSTMSLKDFTSKYKF